MSAENVAVVRSVYENFARGDIPAVLALLALHIEWVESAQDYLPHRGTHRSPDEVASKVDNTAARRDPSHELRCADVHQPVVEPEVDGAFLSRVFAIASLQVADT